MRLSQKCDIRRYLTLESGLISHKVGWATDIDLMNAIYFTYVGFTFLK